MVYDAIDEASLLCAYSPRERTEQSIDAFGARLRASWGETYDGVIDPDELDVIVANIVGGIRRRATPSWFSRFMARSVFVDDRRGYEPGNVAWQSARERRLDRRP